MLSVINARDEQDEDGMDTRNSQLVSMVVLHRINVGETVSEIRKFFNQKEVGTGGKFPYHFIIDRTGKTFYCVSLHRVSPGAAGINHKSFHCALIGDFRKHAPTLLQAISATQLCSSLCKYLNKVEIYGHTSAPGNLTPPDKICPGKFFSIEAIRANVVAALVRDRSKSLEDIGVMP